MVAISAVAMSFTYGMMVASILLSSYNQNLYNKPQVADLKTNELKFISELSKSDSRLLGLLEKFGNFPVTFNKDGMIGSMYLDLPTEKLGFNVLNKDNIKIAGERFVNILYDHGLLSISPSLLQLKYTKFLVSAANAPKIVSLVFFLDSIRGLPVEGDRALVIIMNISNNKIIHLNNYVKDIREESSTDFITPEQALNFAQSRLDSQETHLVREKPLLVYYCTDEKCEKAYRIRSEFRFPSSVKKGFNVQCPSAPIFYVSANGSIVGKKETIFCTKISGTIIGDVYEDPRYLDFRRIEKQKSVSFPDQFVFITINNQETQSTITNQDGYFQFDSNIPEIQSYFLEIPMEGSRVTVKNAKNPSLSALSEISWSTNEVKELLINWGEDEFFDRDPSYLEEESNVYYHINRISKYFSMLDGDAHQQLKVAAVVNTLGNACHAQYHYNCKNIFGKDAPELPCLTFGAAGDDEYGTRCDSMALSPDVIYHEFGHFIVDAISGGGIGYGPMSEGIPDYWAATMTNEPCVIKGFRNQDCLRSLNSDITFIQVQDEAGHDRGVVLSSFLWDLRLALGVTYTDQLVVNTLKLFPESFSDFVYKSLIADDNDGDLNNGTPNYNIICDTSWKHRQIKSEICRPYIERFRRGDSNADGIVDISDATYLLSNLFQGGQNPTCDDAADANDDGSIDISDAIRILLYLFSNDNKIDIPLPGVIDVGSDLTIDTLDCKEY